MMSMAMYNNPYLPQYSSFQQPVYQQQSFTPQAPSIPGAIIGVDGEAAARAYQMPAGIAPGVPIALWDTNGQNIYLKSMNPMGMPNPIQKLTYTREEPPQAIPGQSGSPDYATKADLERLKKEILEGVKTDAKPAV